MKLPKKLTAYSPSELEIMYKTKAWEGQSLDTSNLRDVKQLLVDINYNNIKKRMVTLTKQELKGKISKSSSNELEELIERSTKQYYRMKRWYEKYSEGKVRF